MQCHLFIFVGTLTFQAAFGQTTLQVVWMVPFTSHPTSSYVYNASSSVGAFALGVQKVYNDGILPDHTFNISLIDTNCNSKRSVGALVDLLCRQDVDVVIGPPCAPVVIPVGELLAYRDIPLINWVSLGQSIDYKNELTSYIRTMAPIASLGGIMTLFYYYTGWRRLVMISCEGDDYVGGAETIEINLKYHEVSGFLIAHHYSNVNINASTTEIDQILSSIIHEGRIIILVIPRDELRTYMLRAAHLNMIGGDYQFIFADSRLAHTEDTAYINSDRLWRRGDQFDDQARKAFENVLYFGLGHNSQNVTDWEDDAYAAYNVTFNGRSDIPLPTQPDEFSAYLHDTVVLYAKILNRSIEYGSGGSGKSLLIWSTIEFFKGLSGDVVMSQLGDRQPTFYVYDMDPSGIFHEVASLQYIIADDLSGVSVNSSFTKIVWGDGRTTEDPYIPPDTPPCGFFDENCPPEEPSENNNNVVVIASVSCTMLVVLLAVLLLYRWWRRERDLQTMSWKINYSDLNFNISKRTQSVQESGRLTCSVNSLGSGSLAGTVRSGATSAQTPRHSLTRGQIFTTVALYNGDLVAVKLSKKKKVNMDRSFLLKMKRLYELKHANLTTFVGVCTSPEKVCTVWEYCNKGSIQDVIENDDIHLDTMFKLSLAVDICQGLDYLHKSSLRHHGNMRSSNCVIDSRWVCKLTDFGIEKFKSQQDSEETLGEHAFYARLFWTAPEILRKLLKKEPYEASSHADIYALGIIIKELLCRNEPYSAESHLTPKEIINRVANTGSPEEGAFRPTITDTELDTEYRRTNIEYLIQRCWAEDPDVRPSMKAILRTLNKINPYKKTSVVDNMIAMMEKYTNNLEDIVAERTEQLQEEKLKTDALLYRMLPKQVAEDLKAGRSVQAEAFDSVTIYFSDIVQFTNLAGESTPLEIVALLNALYTLFDDIIRHYDVYKVETIGDAYMIVSGLPIRNGNLHVKEIAGVALSILKSVLTFKIPHKPDRQLEIRIGLHTGPVVAGVVGLTMPRYCLFGDTVNTASRMESNGKPLKIHISGATKTSLDNFPEFLVEERGHIEIKGKGLMTTYWLSGLYSEEEQVCMESKHLDPLDKPKERRDDTDQSGGNDNGDHGNASGDTATDGNEGKLSVADSGICMDRSADEAAVDKSNNEKSNAAETKTDRFRSVSVGCRPTRDNSKDFAQKYPLTNFFCESFKQDVKKSKSETCIGHRDDSVKSNKKQKKKTRQKSSTSRSTIYPDEDSPVKQSTKSVFRSKSMPFQNVTSVLKSPKSKKTKSTRPGNVNSTRNDELMPRNEQIHCKNFGSLDKARELYDLDNVSDDSLDHPTLLIKRDYSFPKLQSVRFQPPPRQNSTDFMTIHNDWFDGYTVR